MDAPAEVLSEQPCRRGDEDIADRLIWSVKRHWQSNQAAFIVVLLLNILALGYALTRDIYTNHTFPNALLLPRPSFRTSEGRWGTDLVYYLLGGSGVPLLSMMLAILAQVANGLLFAHLIGLRGTMRVAICAALTSIHPFMLDYYAYSGDDLSFAIGDTLILAGVAVSKRSRQGLLLAIGLFSFALSVYQPKVSLMLTVIVLTFMAAVVRWRGTVTSLGDVCRVGLTNAACAAGGAMLYFGELAAKEWIVPSPGTTYFRARTHTADLSAMLASAKPLLVNLRDRLFFESNVFPRPIEWLAAALVVGFGVLATKRIRETSDRRSVSVAWALLLASALVMPVCLYAASIISALQMDAARFYVPFAYLNAFLVLMCGEMLRGVWVRRIWRLLSSLFIAGFVVHDAQVLHRAYLSSVQEMSIVARVTERLQSDPRYGSAVPHPVVVFGETPHSWPELTLGAGSITSNFEKRGFVSFRQVEALNFHAGREAFQYPTIEEVEVSTKYASAHSTWPASDSVAILENGIAVVVFDKPGPGVSHTATFGDRTASLR